jgi:aspartyl protease family protein
VQEDPTSRSNPAGANPAGSNPAASIQAPANRDFPGTLKIVTVWGLIGLVVFLAFSAWQHQQAQVSVVSLGDGQKTLSVLRGRDGHYHLNADLNGQTVEFLVDTGASMTTVPIDLALRLGLAKHSSARFSTANGEVAADIFLANLRIADTVEFKQLRVAALPSLNGQALLGMDVLGKFTLAQQAGILRLTRP